MRDSLLQDLAMAADPAKAAFFPRFFKTGPGQYGEGDVFLGVTVPSIRAVVKAHRNLPLKDIGALLADPIHEHRLAALLLLVDRYRRGDADAKEETVRFYLSHLQGVNNWDLVDSSAPYIIGEHLRAQGDARSLETMAQSQNLWEQRIAMVATLAFIRAGDVQPAMRLAAMFLNHPHDLMHKASGWMLREAGKKDREALRAFLRQHAAVMPRTMLRYAIEKMDTSERKHWMQMKELKRSARIEKPSMMKRRHG